MLGPVAAEGLARHGSAHAYVVDVGTGRILRLQEVRRLRDRIGTAPLVALVDEASEPLRRKVLSAGASDVLAGDWQQGTELQDRLLRLLERTGEPGLPGQETRLGALIGASPPMREVFARIRDLAAVVETEPILVTGATGTGKERVAREIHRLSGDPGRPFVAVNCAGRDDSLLDDHLFGHVRGAFTGATGRYDGCLARAAGGALLLDEIGDASDGFQARLLRVVEQREYLPLGDRKARPVLCRILLATHRDLREALTLRSFRADLYFRISALHIHLPPLRERLEDIPLLARAFATEMARPGAAPPIPDDIASQLGSHPWPGNVRELRNYVRQAVQATPPDASTLVLPQLPSGPAWPPGQSVGSDIPRWDEYRTETERAYFLRLLDAAGGNKSQAARIAGMHRTSLLRKLEALGLSSSRE